ncbi:hypothetical protein [Pseudomonas extremaustralis]|uniref:hypothetical protein n=1 Tax=Pseudomonas extremaustralis TaxID=359110 RepID=UPI0023DF3C7A|nr:hypothetical protein [Pseudomonas extremaustralis]MDF3134527.1 hypothetical protein [Pseudomonas extremaustralis]
MTWYKTGTVAVTAGSNAVIGSGTSFIANSRVGDAFRGPDGEWYEVTNIASDTALSIAPNYQGTTLAAGGYSLAPMQGYVKDSADALRAATQVIASGVADMQDQVAAATEAAISAGQSKTVATEQAGIASAAADASAGNKDASQLAAQQSGLSAQASTAAADRAETAKTSIIQSEQAAAASASAAAASAEHAEEVTLGKAASGDNNDITSLSALTADGFDRLRQGIAPMVGATATVAGTKGLVPVASVAERLKVLSGAGVWVPQPTGAAWGAITGTLSAQTDLQQALDALSSRVGATMVNVNGGANLAVNQIYTVTNPFPNETIICEAQVLFGGVWANPRWFGTSGTTTYGTMAGQRFSTTAPGDIYVRTGISAMTVEPAASGSAFAAGMGNQTALPCRVLVWRVKS